MNKNLEILEFHKILDMLGESLRQRHHTGKSSCHYPESRPRGSPCRTGKDKRCFSAVHTVRCPAVPPVSGYANGTAAAKSGAKLSLKDLLEIATILRQMQSLSDWYDRCAGVESTLDDLFSQLAPVPFLLEKLDRSILSEEEIADAAKIRLWRKFAGRSDVPARSCGTHWTA